MYAIHWLLVHHKVHKNSKQWRTCLKLKHGPLSCWANPIHARAEFGPWEYVDVVGFIKLSTDSGNMVPSIVLLQKEGVELHEPNDVEGKNGIMVSDIPYFLFTKHKWCLVCMGGAGQYHVSVSTKSVILDYTSVNLTFPAMFVFIHCILSDLWRRKRDPSGNRTCIH